MNFTTHIPHGDELLDVHFNKVACPSGKYFIEVNSGNNIIASFEMQRDHFNHWRVTQPVPEWIIDHEAHFAQVIATNHFISSQ